MQREGVQRRRRDLGPELLDARRRAGDVVALVVVARRVIALAAAEVQDRLPVPVPVARETNREEGIERPHDDQEIARREVLVDEAQERRAHPRGIRRADVIVVEEHGQQTRVGSRGLGALVGVGFDRDERIRRVRPSPCG